jgi:hypothetical protein
MDWLDAGESIGGRVLASAPTDARRLSRATRTTGSDLLERGTLAGIRLGVKRAVNAAPEGGGEVIPVLDLAAPRKLFYLFSHYLRFLSPVIQGYVKSTRYLECIE